MDDTKTESVDCKVSLFGTNSDYNQETVSGTVENGPGDCAGGQYM